MPELSAMATLDTEDMRVLTRSALGPGVGESSSEAEQEARNFSRTSYVIEDPEDDVDDEITAVFNDETEEAMTRSDMQAMFDDVAIKQVCQLYFIYLGKLRVIGHSRLSAQITIYNFTMTFHIIQQIILFSEIFIQKVLHVRN